MNYPSRKTFFLPEYPIIHLSLSLSCQHHSYVLFASAFPALTFSLRSQAFPVTRRQLPPPPAPVCSTVALDFLAMTLRRRSFGLGGSQLELRAHTADFSKVASTSPVTAGMTMSGTTRTITFLR